MPTLAVTGGKGGTGKSTVAVNLAIALAVGGLEVDLLDLDVECPNDARLSNTPLSKISDVYKDVPLINEKCTGCGICVQKCEPGALYLLNGRANLVEDLCEGCMLCREVCPFNAIDTGKKRVGEVNYGKVKAGKGSVNLIEGKLSVGEDASTQVIREAIKHSKSDVKIIDTAAGTHCTVVKALKLASHAFVVTEPTPFGVSDSKKVMRVLDKLGIPYDIVLNRSGVSNLDLPFSPRFEIPYSREIVDSYISGKPIVLDKPNTSEAKIFLEMAEYARSILFGNEAG